MWSFGHLCKKFVRLLHRCTPLHWWPWSYSSSLWWEVSFSHINSFEFMLRKEWADWWFAPTACTFSSVSIVYVVDWSFSHGFQNCHDLGNQHSSNICTDYCTSSSKTIMYSHHGWEASIPKFNFFITTSYCRKN